MSILKNIVKTVTNILLVTYPFIIFFALYYNHLNLAIVCLIILFILRLLTSAPLFSQMKWLVKTISFLGIFLAISSLLLSRYQLLLYYPVIVNFSLFTLFSYSLKHPPTIIERFALIQQSQLPESAIRYTRKVTLFWCLFFIANGSIALITCLLNNLEWWVIYNGGISYIFIAILVGGEWLIRRKYQR